MFCRLRGRRDREAWLLRCALWVACTASMLGLTVGPIAHPAVANVPIVPLAEESGEQAPAEDFGGESESAPGSNSGARVVHDRETRSPAVIPGPAGLQRLPVPSQPTRPAGSRSAVRSEHDHRNGLGTALRI